MWVMPPPRIDPTMPSTIVQKIVMCSCITDFAITPETSPIKTYQIKWNIPFPPSFAFSRKLPFQCRFPRASTDSRDESKDRHDIFDRETRRFRVGFGLACLIENLRLRFLRRLSPPLSSAIWILQGNGVFKLIKVAQVVAATRTCLEKSDRDRECVRTSVSDSSKRKNGADASVARFPNRLCSLKIKSLK